MQSSLLQYTSPRIEGRDKHKARDIHTRCSNSCTTTEDILDSILPPREWTVGGEVWVQSVSSTPATRADVVTLQKELEKRLKIRRARGYGICSMREELYSQCFDEIIRQVTIACAERGLLLNRIRGEIRNLISAHRSVYESSAAFGVRKALQAEEHRRSLDERIRQLTQDNQVLEDEITASEETLKSIECEHNAKVAEEEEEHTMTVQSIRRKIQKVKHELERLLSITTRR